MHQTELRDLSKQDKNMYHEDWIMRFLSAPNRTERIEYIGDPDYNPRKFIHHGAWKRQMNLTP